MEQVLYGHSVCKDQFIVVVTMIYVIINMYITYIQYMIAILSINNYLHKVSKLVYVDI